MKRPLLGEVLIAEKALTQKELTAALEAQKKEQGLLGIILVKRGIIDTDTLDMCLRIQARRSFS